MKPMELMGAWKANHASPKDMAEAGRRSVRQAAEGLGGLARSLAARRPAAMAAAGKFGRRNRTVLIAGGAMLGLAAAGLLARSAIRAAQAKRRRLKGNGSMRLATPASQLGRDAAHQGESGGLAEYAEARPDAQTGGRPPYASGP